MCRQGSVRGNPSEGDCLGYPDVDGRILLRLIFRKCDLGLMDWIELAHRDRWRAFVNAGGINPPPPEEQKNLKLSYLL